MATKTDNGVGSSGGGGGRGSRSVCTTKREGGEPRLLEVDFRGTGEHAAGKPTSRMT